jgi:hypothetical protein
MNWDWEDTWKTLFICLVILTVGFLGKLATAPKNVDYYYMSHGSSTGPAVCVYAHWTWHQDEVTMCTDDAMRAEDFTAKANAGLRH